MAPHSGTSREHSPMAFALYFSPRYSPLGTELVGFAAFDTPHSRRSPARSRAHSGVSQSSKYSQSSGQVSSSSRTETSFGCSVAQLPPPRLSASSIAQRLEASILPFASPFPASTSHAVFDGSRTLAALAETGYAPRFFRYVGKSGRQRLSFRALWRIPNSFRPDHDEAFALSIWTAARTRRSIRAIAPITKIFDPRRRWEPRTLRGVSLMFRPDKDAS